MFESKCVETAEGARIHYLDHGEGRPVLLLHGFSGCARDWVDAPLKWPGGDRLIAIDLKGHGESSPLTKPFTHREAAADILFLVDKLGIDRFAAVGVSAGGNVLLHLATHAPGRVEAMVLVSATASFPAQAREIMSRYRESLTDEGLARLRSVHFQPRQLERILASGEAFATSHDDLDFTPDVLSGIRARTLIVQGDSDPLYPVEMSVELANAIPSSTLWIVPGAGHGAGIGSRWDEFFLAAHRHLRGGGQ